MSRSATALKRRESVQGFAERFGIAIVAIVLLIAFSLISDRFLTANNVFNIFKQVAHIAVLSIGMTFVFLIGGMDLSAGANVFLGAVVVAALLDSGVSIVPAMLAAIAMCGLMGAVNGFVVEFLHINCVIVTLGSQLAIRGIALLIIGHFNQWIYVKHSVMGAINTGTLGPIPILLLITLILYVLAYLILRQTGFGRKVYAVGGNERAAKLCGLHAEMTKAMCYLVSGISAGVAGIIIASRLGMVSTTIGIGLEFDAVTAVVLGGVSLKGGEGSVFKTLIGALIVGMIANFMTLYGVNEHFQDAAMGAFILLAAVSNRLTQRDAG